MTPEQAAKRIAQLELQLHIADFGLGMPRDYELVLSLRGQLEDARKDMTRAILERVEAA